MEMMECTTEFILRFLTFYPQSIVIWIATRQIYFLVRNSGGRSPMYALPLKSYRYIHLRLFRIIQILTSYIFISKWKVVPAFDSVCFYLQTPYTLLLSFRLLKESLLTPCIWNPFDFPFTSHNVAQPLNQGILSVTVTMRSMHVICDWGASPNSYRMW